jgi:hypothetical protein
MYVKPIKKKFFINPLEFLNKITFHLSKNSSEPILKKNSQKYKDNLFFITLNDIYHMPKKISKIASWDLSGMFLAFDQRNLNIH